ncbi:hypothetical protein ACFE04_006525 [Oxalis oulophora]
MGVEVAGFEMAKALEVDNGKLDTAAKVAEPIKFGSQGDEPVKAKAVVDDNIPKNAAFEWPTAKAVHSFYFVRYRPFEDPKIRAKIDQADKEIQKKNQARSPLTDELRAKKSERAELISQLKALKADGRQFKMILDEKKKDIAPLQQALGKLRTTSNAGSNGGICSSEDELNKLIRSLEYHMQHESIPLSEEKQILREIKQLEGTREKVIANSVMRAKIQDSLGQKDSIQDQVKLMGADLDGVRKDHQNVWTKINKLEEKLKVVDGEINALQEELTTLFQNRDKAFGKIHELRKQREEENTFFKQSREVLAQAKLLAVAEGEKRKEAILELEQLSRKEVDNFIALFSKDKSFREDYQRRILSSLDQRQFSKDGRIRNPDEKPILYVEPTVEPEAVTKAPVKRSKEEPKSSAKEVALPSEKIPKDVSKNESKSKEESVDEANEETFVVEKPRKDAAKEKIDEAKLKELKREEEIAKAKQAMERKKKLAEKAAAKAALRAEKEAEKKLKDLEKKAKKKAAASQVKEESTEPSEEASEPEKVEETVEATPPVKQQKVQKEKIVRSRNRTRGGPEMVPRPILKRKKSNNFYWMLAAPVGLAVLILLVLGYYYFL